MRGASKGDALLNVVDLGRKSEICDFDLFVLEQNIGRFDIPVEKTLGGEVAAS